MKLVVIESPYAGTVQQVVGQLIKGTMAPDPKVIGRHMNYLDRCIIDCLKRNESPYASHRMLTDALDDTDPIQRAKGIEAGMAFGERADARIFFVDLGWSPGMKQAKDYYSSQGLSIQVRRLDPVS